MLANNQTPSIVTNMIDPNTPIQLIDTQTKSILKSGTYAKVRSFRATANRKDLNYGANRYIVKVVWQN